MLTSATRSPVATCSRRSHGFFRTTLNLNFGKYLSSVWNPGVTMYDQQVTQVAADAKKPASWVAAGIAKIPAPTLNKKSQGQKFGIRTKAVKRSSVQNQSLVLNGACGCTGTSLAKRWMAKYFFPTFSSPRLRPHGQLHASLPTINLPC